MKNLILAFVLLFGISITANAQTTLAKLKSGKSKVEVKATVKEAVLMTDNKVLLCSDNKCVPLTKTFVCTDGCKVSTDGTITNPKGMTMKLQNGYKMDKDGKMAMITHGEAGHVCNADCAMSKKM